MTEREGFLGRWSRKKTEAARDEIVAPPVPPTVSPAPDALAKDHPPAEPKVQSKAEPKQEFDFTQLPSLESITSATDIRAFLAPGVPSVLSRAALRRAWVADPAIRDFVGLAENAWDFTNPNAMPGFGDIPIGTDLKKMVAEVFGELQKAAEPGGDTAPEPPQPQPETAQIAEESKQTAPAEDLVSDNGGFELPASPAPNPDISDGIVQRDNIGASQQSNDQEEIAMRKTRRSHGRALPE